MFPHFPGVPCFFRFPFSHISTRRYVTGTLASVLFLLLLNIGSSAQELSRRPADSATQPPATPAPAPAAPLVIPLTVPPGTPIKVTLDHELRVRNVGQPVHGKVVEPVYAFDQLVIPAGSEVFGKISAIGAVSRKQRTLSALNADFSPSRQVRVDFSALALPDGRRVPIRTSVSPASAGVLKFVSAKGNNTNPPAPGSSTQGNSAPQPPDAKEDHGKGRASREIADIREDLKAKMHSVKSRITQPDKMHRLKQYALAQSPYRPQYMEPGTAFDADLAQPLDFGAERVSPEKLTALGAQPPNATVVHARLVTALTSATAKPGDPVDAVITQPVIAGNQIFFPEGSHLKGTVLQARPARWLGHSGQLRITFHQIVPPNGIAEKLEASLQAVAVTNGERLALDSEGGAQVTQPKSRYFTTALSAVLSTTSALDRDAGHRTPNASGGDVGKGAANGAFGFRLVGTVLGAVSRSRVVSSGLGFYGTGFMVYSHFLARGNEVVYPRNMAMLVELATRDSKSKANQTR